MGQQRWCVFSSIAVPGGPTCSTIVQARVSAVEALHVVFEDSVLPGNTCVQQVCCIEPI